MPGRKRSSAANSASFVPVLPADPVTPMIRPWLRARALPVMAYSPFDQGRLLRQRGLVTFAREHGMTPAQVALAWLLAQDGVIAIPKTGRRARLEENAGALAHRLSRAQLQELDRLFPPPDGPTPLAML